MSGRHQNLPSWVLARALSLLLAILCCSVAARAQYPSKPIVLIVPSAAGGTHDHIGRSLAQDLRDRLRWQVIVENHPGANGVVASTSVLRRASDGYTLLLANSYAHSIVPARQSNLPFDVARDFVGVIELAASADVLVARSDSPAKSVNELIALSRAQTGSVKYGTVGPAGLPSPGSTSQLSGDVFKKSARVSAVEIPFRTSDHALAEVAAGNLSFAFVGLEAAQRGIKAGQLRALAVTSQNRSALLAGVPTMRESGLPAFTVDNYVGVLAPRSTPASVVDLLHRELGRSLENAEVRHRIEALGFEVTGRAPREFEARLRDDTKKWSSHSHSGVYLPRANGGSGIVPPGGTGAAVPASATLPPATALPPDRADPAHAAEASSCTAFWNAWFEQSDEVVQSLKLNQPYRFVLDISRLQRIASASAAASPVVKESLCAAQTEVKLTLRVMLTGNVLRLENSQSRTSERSLDVTTAKLKQDVLAADEAAAWRAGQIKPSTYLANASAGHLALDVATVASGCGSIAVSVWDGVGTKPLDHIVYPFAVGDAEKCQAAGKLRSGLDFALSIPSATDAGGLEKVDAAIHVFELAADDADEGSVVWMIDRRAFESAPEGKTVGGVYAWQTQSSVRKYVQEDSQLPALLEAARKAATADKEFPYAVVAEELRKKIFSVSSDEVFGDAARNAQAALADLVNNATTRPAVVLARLVVSAERLGYVPLGLLSARSENNMFRKPFLTVQPMRKERLLAGKTCVDPWTLGVPSTLDGLDDSVKTELAAFAIQSGGWYSFKRSIGDLRDWFKSAIPSGTATRAEGLVLLAHHDDGNLWFEQQNERLVQEDFARSFRRGSVALVSACSVGGAGPLAHKLIDALNNKNIDAMVVSPFPVRANFGTLLALNFVREIDKERTQKRTPSLAELYASAWARTVDQLKASDSRDYFEMGLEFVILGDPGIRLCAD